MAKEDSLKVFIVGEVLRASHLNQLTENVGAVQYLAPWTTSLTKDSSGVVFLGTTSAPFGGLVFKSGYKMLETADNSTTTEITLSGGGGSGIGNIELVSQQEKLLNNVSLSESLFLNESYSNPDKYSMNLGKSYGTGDLSVIYLHPNYSSISKCNALADGTGNWTALGAQAGAAVVGGTTYIEGNAAIYTTVSATTGENGLRFKLGTNVISMSDRKLRFGLWLSTLSNISTVRTKLTTSAGTSASKYWDLTAQASGSALISGWNFMEVNTAGTASGSAGTYIEGNTKEVHVLITPTSSQSFVMAVDDVCTVQRKELWLPDIWQIGDTNNTQLIHVNSGANGRYLLGTTVLTNYAIESTLIAKKLGRISDRKYYINTGTGQIPYSGNLAKKVWCINTKHFNETFTAKTLTISSEEVSNEFEIIDIPSSTSLKLKVIASTGEVLSFVAGNKIRVYPKKWNGINYDNPYNATFASNYKELTISGSSSVSGAEITINHTENNSGVDANGDFYVCKINKEIYYRTEEDTTGLSLIKFTPTKLKLIDNDVAWDNTATEYFLFDKSSGSVTGKKAGITAPITGTLNLEDGILGKRVGGFSTTNYITTSNPAMLAGSIIGKIAWQFTTTFVQNGAYQYLLSEGADNARFNIAIYNDNTLRFGLPGLGNYYTNISSAVLAPYCDGKEHDLYCEFDYNAALKYSIYIDGVLLNSASTGNDITVPAAIYIGASNSALYPWAGKVSDFTKTIGYHTSTTTRAKKYNGGNLKKYGYGTRQLVSGTVSNQAGQKLTLATNLNIEDTTNEINTIVDISTNALLS